MSNIHWSSLFPMLHESKQFCFVHLYQFNLFHSTKLSLHFFHSQLQITYHSIFSIPIALWTSSTLHDSQKFFAKNKQKRESYVQWPFFTSVLWISIDRQRPYIDYVCSVRHRLEKISYIPPCVVLWMISTSISRCRNIEFTNEWILAMLHI